MKTECNYCHTVISSGISQLNHHLAMTHLNVAAYTSRNLSDAMKWLCQQLISGLRKKRQEKEMSEAEMGYAQPWEDEYELLTSDHTTSSITLEVGSSIAKEKCVAGDSSSVVGTKRRGKR